VLTAIDVVGYPKSVKPLLTALNLSDMAILCVSPEGLDAHAGECVVALDTLGYKHGIIVLTKSDTSYPYALDELQKNIKKITSGTALEKWGYISVSTTSFEGMEELKEMIFAIGEKVDEENAKLNDSPPRVVIDQCFNVTGIGCVALGVLSRGTIHAKDKMNVYPVNKPLEIRSIQLHDVDAKSAPAGSRVGLALKNIQSKEIERGSIVSDNETVSTDLKLKCVLSQFTKGLSVGDVLHIFVGLQSAPCRVEKIIANGEDIMHAGPGKECTVKFSGSKEIAYIISDRFILSSLDEKQRFVGYGFSQ
jgi:selenocysteine-specific elongation factor